MGSRQRIHRVAALLLACTLAGVAQVKRIPEVAGEFYPSDAGELRLEVDRLLAGARTPAGIAPVALISPHAGYAYSGAVAAEGYASIRGAKIRRVVVIAPSHFEAFDFNAVYDGAAYVTPLGEVPVDREFAAQLARRGGPVRLSPRGHRKAEQRGEHSLEVQLPFLQRVLAPGFAIVPVVMGQQTYALSRALGLALAGLVKGSDTLIVASSDLSHYHPYADAVALDRRALRAIQEWDYLALSRNFDANIWEACGGGPVIAALIAAERLGAQSAQLLRYANSGDVTAEKSRVVGYASLALRRAAAPATAAGELTAAERRELLAIARTSAETAVRDRRVPRLTVPASANLVADRGVFVTLKQHGELRGCVGNTSAAQPLYLAVRDVAALAAVRDPRFQPVSIQELSGLHYEISVLSPMRRLLNPTAIQVGTHGLAIRKGEREGILLPQVATEENLSRDGFLEMVSQKAGLDKDAWRDPEADIFVFTAEVFADSGLAK